MRLVRPDNLQALHREEGEMTVTKHTSQGVRGIWELQQEFRIIREKLLFTDTRSEQTKLRAKCGRLMRELEAAKRKKGK
jgi:hypothetical protein